MENINTREVAQIAGVSPSIVSRVINGSAKVFPEKTAKAFGVEFVTHVELKALTGTCRAVIRTGGTTPYVNIILQSGCIFS